MMPHVMPHVMPHGLCGQRAELSRASREAGDAEEAKKKAVEEAIAKVQKEATTEIVKRLAEQREKLQAEKEEAIALELHNQEKSVSVKARAELEFVQAQVDAKVDEAVTKEREKAAADVAAIMKAKGSEGAQASSGACYCMLGERRAWRGMCVAGGGGEACVWRGEGCVMRRGMCVARREVRDEARGA